jgi:hypothetical protein
VYDSLAPLNPPSNPIVYKEDASKTQENSIGKSSIELDSRQDEKAKLESILLTSMSESSGGTMGSSSIGGIHHKMESHGHVGRFGATGTLLSGSGWPRPPGTSKPVPSNYICPICKKPGHTKNMCPDAGKLGVKQETYRYPSGIPMSFLVHVEKDNKFAMKNMSGSYVVPEIEHKVSQIIKKDNSIQFLTEEEEEEKQRQKKSSSGDQPGSKGSFQPVKFPKELKCPFGEHIIKDAVLVPCCGHFICCDECIREKIYNDEYVECPYEECDQEIGPLESITPYHQMRKLVSDFLNDAKLTNQRAAAVAAQQTSTGVSSNPSVNNSAAKSNDVFFDLLLNEVENPSVSSINKLTNAVSANQTNADTNIIKSASPPIEEMPELENAEKESLNKNELIIKADGDGEEDGEISKSVKEPWSSPSSSSSSKSPLQDSKISSSVANLSNINQQQQHQQQSSALTSLPLATSAESLQPQQQALLPTPPSIDRSIGIATQSIPPVAIRPSGYNFPTAASELSAANAYSMNITKYNQVRNPAPSLINQGPMMQSGPTYPIQIGGGFNQPKVRNIVPPMANTGQPLRSGGGFIQQPASASIRPGLMIPPPLHQPSMQQSQPAFVNPNVPYVGNQMVPGQTGTNFGQQSGQIYLQAPPITNQMGAMYQQTPMGLNPRNPLVGQGQFNGPSIQPYGINTTSTNQMLNGPSTMVPGSQASLLGVPPSSIIPPQSAPLGQGAPHASSHIYDSRIGPVSVNPMSTTGPMPLNPIIGSAAGVLSQPVINPAPIQQSTSLIPKMGLMSEEEFYNYREQLKKEAEMQQHGYLHKNRSRKRSASRSMSGSYSRSSSRSHSRSRSRRRYSPAPLNAASSHHYNRSYSRSRTRSRTHSRSYSSRSRSRSRSRSYYSKSRSPSTRISASRRHRRRSGSDSRSKMRNYVDRRSQKSHNYGTSVVGHAVSIGTTNIASLEISTRKEQRNKSERSGKEAKNRHSPKTSKSNIQEGLGLISKSNSDTSALVAFQKQEKLENETEPAKLKYNVNKSKEDKNINAKREHNDLETGNQPSTNKKHISNEKKHHKEKVKEKERSKDESKKEKESEKDRERKRTKEHRHEGPPSKRSSLLGENVLITVDASNARHVSSTLDHDASTNKKKKVQTNGSNASDEALDSVIVAKVESQAAAAIAAVKENNSVGNSTNGKDGKDRKDSKDAKESKDKDGKKHKHKHKKKHKHKHRSSPKH